MKIGGTLVLTEINRKTFSRSSRSSHIGSVGRCKISFFVQTSPVD